MNSERGESDVNDRPIVPRRPLQGQVLPPLREDLQLPPAPLRIPLLARMKYRSEERQIEAYTRLVAAKNLLLSVLDDQRLLLIAREISIERMDNLSSIREIERLKIRNELKLLEKDAELEELLRSVQIEELRVRLGQAKRLNAELENPTPPPPKRTVAEQIEEALVELREVDDLFNQRRDELIKAAGGVANLSEDERQTLERLEILRRTHVEKLHEDLL